MNMKTKAVTVFSTALLLSGTLVSIASAQGVANVHANANANIEVRAQGNSTSTAARSDIAIHDNANGQLTAESHRSAVASFVQSLLNVANREGGIGAQVRIVAQSQQDSASTSANAIAKVENRGGFRTFLLGSDYKSLGQLRSEMATTSANIAKLQELLAKTTSDSDKADLSAQIQVLEDSQAKIDAFVIKQSSIFSLFGWFTKLFTK